MQYAKEGGRGGRMTGGGGRKGGGESLVRRRNTRQFAKSAKVRKKDAGGLFKRRTREHQDLLGGPAVHGLHHEGLHGDEVALVA